MPPHKYDEPIGVALEHTLYMCFSCSCAHSR